MRRSCCRIKKVTREQERPTRWIKEAVHIRKEGHPAMNRDKGSYQLSHAYNCFLDATLPSAQIAYYPLQQITWP